MSIEYSIIESVYQTLISDSSLNKFVTPKKDIYKGIPTNEQNVSKNSITIEPDVFKILETNFISKTEAARRFSCDLILLIDYTQETKQESLEKFLEFTALIVNSIDKSTYILSNTAIKKVELVEIEEIVVDKNRLLVRGAGIKYQFTGVYNTGNL